MCLYREALTANFTEVERLAGNHERGQQALAKLKKQFKVDPTLELNARIWVEALAKLFQAAREQK